MLKLLIITSFFVLSDSSKIDTSKMSILFLNKKDTYKQQELKNIRYKHQQGFFCDFEDRISKNRKMFINLGVGNQ